MSHVSLGVRACLILVTQSSCSSSAISCCASGGQALIRRCVTTSLSVHQSSEATLATQAAASGSLGCLLMSMPLANACSHASASRLSSIRFMSVRPTLSPLHSLALSLSSPSSSTMLYSDITCCGGRAALTIINASGLRICPVSCIKYPYSTSSCSCVIGCLSAGILILLPLVEAVLAYLVYCTVIPWSSHLRLAQSTTRSTSTMVASLVIDFPCEYLKEYIIHYLLVIST